MELTDNEIIKALECCAEENKCQECPYGTACLDDRYVSILSRDSLDLIKRLQEENVRLSIESTIMHGVCDSYKIQYDNLQAEIKSLKKSQVKEIHIDKEFYEECQYEMKQAKSEARKELAERLKEIGQKRLWICGITETDIDNLLKEMEQEDA